MMELSFLVIMIAAAQCATPCVDDWTPGFQASLVTNRTRDGRNATLLEDLVYITKSGVVLTMPAGSTTDGGSVPRWLWWLIAPFGDYWMATVLHDGLYRGKVLFIDRTQAFCDTIFFESMDSLGVGRAKAWIVFEAVHLFGRRPFIQGRHNAGEDV